ncbi:MAG TPA: aryl-sulfate sulfotransferase [Flavobacteriales bacterium]|nr:aryl-sulfate sulfotransferase [Flavobacteriales bacterium]
MQFRFSHGLMAMLAIGLCRSANGQAFDGYALYNSANSTTARLINAQQNIAYTWTCPTNYSYSMAMKPNGNIVRTAVNTGNQINTAAVSGKVQELNPQGQVVWEFVYSTADYVTHHDICLMPNGNVLLLAYVKRTLAQLQALGYTGSSAKYPGRIIEIQPTGTTAQVVWQWEMQDRFIQYVDATKPNYMPIADNPHRMNINVAVSGGGFGNAIDWFHENGIDYNAELDQIAFSARYLSEVFIIDHSTTTAEAAGHVGGNAGRGGDFLFRWGKPANYGGAGTQRIPAAVHDVKWVKEGAMAGWLMFVNNNGGGNNSSTVDAINPTRTEYTYPWTPGTVWGPTIHDWRHTCLAYASGQSAAEIMPNGNVFCAMSGQYMYEVNSNGQLVWQYNAGPQKAFRYTCDHPGIINLLNDPCGITTDVPNEEELAAFSMYPNPAQEQVSLVGVNVETLRVFAVHDASGRAVKRELPGWTIAVGDLPDGVYNVVLEHSTGEKQTRKLVVAH